MHNISNIILPLILHLQVAYFQRVQRRQRVPATALICLSCCHAGVSGYINLYFPIQFVCNLYLHYTTIDVLFIILQIGL